MSELVHSTLLQDQAIKLVETLVSEQEEGSITPDEVKERLLDIVTRFEEKAGRPLLDYGMLHESEPALSAKVNRIWRAIAADIDVSQHQLDLNRAAAIASFNFVSTEVEKAKQLNDRLNNRLKSLQLYSNISDESLVSFGDSFQSLDFMDRELVQTSNALHLAGPGYVTLPRSGPLKNLAPTADIRVLGTSNGFIGNNQTATENEDGTITFDSDLTDPSNLNDLLDGQPDTWIEYENYFINEANRLSAGNFNFEYINENGERTSWATGPENGVLKLALEMDLGSVQLANSVSFSAFPLKENINFPIYVRLVETSSDSTDWVQARPTKVNVATNFNLESLRTAENLTLNQAIWSFDSRSVRYIRLYMEQRNPIDANIGHSYWVDTSSDDLPRVEGPLPQVGQAVSARDQVSSGDLEQRFEIIPGQRWAIGIRDIEVNQVDYKTKGSFVSERMRVDGVVDRVILEDADFEVPDSFDSSTSWVRFYVSPDDGESWLPISEIEDYGRDIPEQISFNDPLPEEMQEPGVKNYSTDQPVNFLRFKIEMERPADQSASTPVLKSYRIKVKRR